MTRLGLLPTSCAIAILHALLPGTAEAACRGASPDWTAASAAQADVADCVAAATSGDTIAVPSGTEVWADPIELPGDKSIAIVGATEVECNGTPITCTATDATSITCSAGVCFVLDLGASQRISGFTLLEAAEGGVSVTGEQLLDEHFRIDHNHIVSSSGWAPMELTGGSTAVHPQGIVDANLLVDVAIHTNGTNFQLDEGDQQHILWAQQTQLGDSEAIVYIEDNHFENTADNINNADSNYGGRYVYRFNNSTSGRQAVEFHSVQGENRAGQRFEIYGNSGSSPDGFSGVAFLRGGSGVAFGNRLAADWPSFGILMDNVRSEEDPGGGVGMCDGSSDWDQNTAGQMGYRCRDQIGSSHDLSQWTHQPPAAYDQALQPVYFWDNLAGDAAMDIDDSGLATWIAENRDWYRDGGSFDGTAGVGVGPIGERPKTCTEGVAYWATDEGDWNHKQGGPDGNLYCCGPADAWSLCYTPYDYPHPWTGFEPPGETDGGTEGSGTDSAATSMDADTNGTSNTGGGTGEEAGTASASASGPSGGTDGGTDDGTAGGSDGGGCGCGSGARGGGSVLAALLVAFGLARRRHDSAGNARSV